MTGDAMCTKYGFSFKEAPLGNWPSETTKFLMADEVKEIAKAIITKFRTDLVNINIGYIFKAKASKNGEFTTLGQAKTESELQQVLHGIEAIIIIGFDTWKDLSLDEKARLVYHELEHLGWDEKSGKLKTTPHLVEEFPSVIQAFGPGSDSQIAFINAWEKFKSDNPSPTKP